MCSRFSSLCNSFFGSDRSSIASTHVADMNTSSNNTGSNSNKSKMPRVERPTPVDILRYRYQHGCNCGSVFVLERWLSNGMFLKDTAGDSELAAVGAFLNQNGLAATKAKWENHWSNYISNADLVWLSESANCTTIRLPVGYYTLGPDFCSGTPFSREVASVYTNAWSACKSLINRAAQQGIGTILDFHALPGGANCESHSGTNSGRAELWNGDDNLKLAKRCILFMAQEISTSLKGVVGLQLCNEAITNAPGIYEWYTDVIEAIAKIDASIPIYISDGWDVSKALEYSQVVNRSTETPRNPVIVDTHKYYCFTSADRSATPQSLISRVSSELSDVNTRDGNVLDHGARAVFVGEYSCVLHSSSWSQVPASSRVALTQEFGRAQCERWQECSTGSTFWTYKMDWMDGGDWGFKHQTLLGNILAPKHFDFDDAEIVARGHSALAQRAVLKDAATTQHIGYWNEQAPGVKFEHWRYEDGWEAGFNDAFMFFTMRRSGELGQVRKGGDRIGSVDMWTLKRLRDTKQEGGLSWEWEHGFRKGIKDFEGVGFA